MTSLCPLMLHFVAAATLVSCVSSTTGSCTTGSCSEGRHEIGQETVDDVILFQTRLRLSKAAVDENGNAAMPTVEFEAHSRPSQQPQASEVQTEAHELPSFASFMATHGRTYSIGSEEYKARLALFEQRASQVKSHNSLENRLWTASVNHLADRTEEELQQLRGWRGFARRSGGSARSSQSLLSVSQSKQAALPEQFSWGNLNAITSNSNQGGCGSCWAFATITMMNAVDEIAGNGRRFSEQDLVDCVPNPYHCGGSGGCTGATVELAMNWIAKYGLRLESQSPYLGYDSVCKVSMLEQGAVASSNKSASEYNEELEQMIALGVHDVKAGSPGAALGINYWTRLPENEYWPLLAHVVAHGPIAVSVAADTWLPYSHGIFTSCSPNGVINHAVVLFGYGIDATSGPSSGVKFWAIKNSWGAGWGENGNMRLLREENPMCGIDRQPEVGTGCDGGPSKVEVCGMCGILYDVVSVAM